MLAAMVIVSRIVIYYLFYFNLTTCASCPFQHAFHFVLEVKMSNNGVFKNSSRPHSKQEISAPKRGVPLHIKGAWQLLYSSAG